MKSSEEYFKKKRLTDSRKIYRIITFPRVLELLHKKVNVLVEPCKWKDPLEGWLRNEIFRLYKGRNLDSDSGIECGKFFGQCWTTDYASDLMWNMYSEGTNGFRIRSTVKKIKCSLKTLKNEDYWYISPINYKNFSKLESYNRDDLEYMHSNDTERGLRHSLAQSFMIKRKGYMSEHEVRLICSESKPEREDGLFEYGIDPNCMIDQIMMHPGMSCANYKYYRRIFRCFSFEGEILKSTLYQKPDSIANFCLL